MLLFLNPSFTLLRHKNFTIGLNWLDKADVWALLLIFLDYFRGWSSFLIETSFVAKLDQTKLDCNVLANGLFVSLISPLALLDLLLFIYVRILQDLVSLPSLSNLLFLCLCLGRVAVFRI